MTAAKRFLLGAGITLATTLGSTIAGAQNYPNKLITVIIPFAGGSASDVVARIMLDKMSKNMKQTIVIENRPGAGGNSGTGADAKAPPAGRTAGRHAGPRGRQHPVPHLPYLELLTTGHAFATGEKDDGEKQR